MIMLSLKIALRHRHINAISKFFFKNLQTYSCFDTCGHIDYVVRYGPSKNVHYCYKNHADILDEILKTLIDKGIGLECNTAGFKYGLGQPHPSTEILKRYKELGGELLTLGSDAHAPCHIAYDFQKASDLLKACGFRYYTIFKEKIGMYSFIKFSITIGIFYLLYPNSYSP